MDTLVLRKQTAFHLREDLISKLKSEAKRNNRSLNNYVESVLMEYLYHEPNAETLEAMGDARNSHTLTSVDVPSFENFLKSVE